MTTGPGLIMPMATAIRNWRSSIHPVCRTSPFWRKGTMTRPLPNVSAPAFRKKRRSLARIEPVAGTAEETAAGPSGATAISDAPNAPPGSFRRSGP